MDVVDIVLAYSFKISSIDGIILLISFANWLSCISFGNKNNTNLSGCIVISICACSSSNISGLISSNLTVLTLLLCLLFIYNSDNNILLCIWA